MKFLLLVLLFVLLPVLYDVVDPYLMRLAYWLGHRPSTRSDFTDDHAYETQTLSTRERLARDTAED